MKAIATTAAIEVANETIAKAVGDTVSSDLQQELRQMRSMIERLQRKSPILKAKILLRSRNDLVVKLQHANAPTDWLQPATNIRERIRATETASQVTPRCHS